MGTLGAIVRNLPAAPDVRLPPKTLILALFVCAGFHTLN
jgi:hypothetical protein